MDAAAATIADLVQQQPQSSTPRVTHVYNRSTKTSWEDITGYLKYSGMRLGNNIEPSEWLEQLDSLDPNHPAKPLMGLWSASVSQSSLCSPLARLTHSAARQDIRANSSSGHKQGMLPVSDPGFDAIHSEAVDLQVCGRMERERLPSVGKSF